MRLSLRLLAVAAFAAAAWGFAAPSASAQNQAPSPAPDAGDLPTAIPDQKLDAAAVAIDRIANLHRQYEQQLAEAAPENREAIAKEADGAMAKAVNDQGLSVKEYNSIVDAAQRNPAFREKLLQRLQQHVKPTE
jgi:hypothetical protein